MKYQTAGLRKLDQGIKKGIITQRVIADMVREMKEPVSEFDVTRPRRTRTWETAKHKDAKRAKYSAISRRQRLFQLAGGEHQGFHGYGNDFCDPHGNADVDIVQVTYLNPIHSNDLSIELEFLFQDRAQ